MPGASPRRVQRRTRSAAGMSVSLVKPVAMVFKCPAAVELVLPPREARPQDERMATAGFTTSYGLVHHMVRREEPVQGGVPHGSSFVHQESRSCLGGGCGLGIRSTGNRPGWPGTPHGDTPASAPAPMISQSA